ncbi:hypothetical protein R3W88_027356 [Solanum pinnatisectum]|uniref:Aldehyde dehydrogenase domain-containing protein n=1 Tax=Solanum pinnatisectum TaxID=50273 RepID=A0AAV9LH11_9SOLN|nr:hypothetical protein R3W88_027356 [Solanum pinnatisectum]
MHSSYALAIWCGARLISEKGYTDGQVLNVFDSKFLHEVASDLLFKKRSKVLLHLAKLIEKHNDQIATFETWDTGKPYEQAVKIGVHWLYIPIIMLVSEKFNWKESLSSIISSP